jgi:hypothetical protein
LIVGGAGTATGVIIAILGFVLWYRRLQVPQDSALRAAMVPMSKEKVAHSDEKSGG